MWVRTSAGWLLIAAGTGLAAISGTLAYHGFEAMIAIPFAGWIGPCIAASLIGLGVAVEIFVRERAWIAASVLGVLLIGAGWLDKHSGQLALTAKVEAAAQADADRKAAYDTALRASGAADRTLAGLEAELALLSGNDVVAIQKHVGTNPDGNWGQKTADRVAVRKDQIAAEKQAAQDERRKWADVVAAGAPASTLPFSLKDAELYATLVTLLSIVLAFAGSFVAHGPARDEVAETAAALTELERNVFELHDWIEARAA